MGSGSSRTVVTNAAESISADVLVNIASSCNVGATATQAIDIQCQPTVTNPSGVYEMSTNCQSCLNQVRENSLGYYQRQRELWNGTQAPGVRKPIDADYQQIITAMVECNRACKACVVEDVSQRTLIKQVTTCEAFNNVRNSLNQKLAANITQKLTNNQDWLSGFASLLGHGSTQSLVNDLTLRVSDRLTDNVISDVQSQISQTQTVSFVERGTDTLFQSGLSQQSALHSVQTWIQKNNIMNNLLTEAEFNTLQNLVNNQNTINTLGNTVVKAVGYLSKLVNNVAGRVLLFVVITVACIIGAVIVFWVVHFTKHEIHNYETRKLHRQQLMEEEPVFRTL